MCEPHSIVPWCCVIVVHCECKDHSPFFFGRMSMIYIRDVFVAQPTYTTPTQSKTHE
jgi:hypothetical protein